MNKIALIIFIFSYSVIFSQIKQISGLVKDYQTNKPLQYVNIYIKGTTIGTVSNINGDFYLSNNKINKNDTIIFSIISYEPSSFVIKDLNKNTTIKLKSHCNKIDKVTVNAKRTDPTEILKKAIQRINKNVYNKKYHTKVLSRNFVQKDSIFIQYRKTLTKAISYKDDVWGGKGTILADKYYSLPKNIFKLIKNKKVNTFFINAQNFDYSRYYSEKSINYINKNVVNIDTVIFSGNKKIYVVDLIDKSANPRVLTQVRRFINKNPSPYTVIFDKKAQSDIINSFETNNHKMLYFVRYYIDASQNYNIIKAITYGIYSSFDIIQMNKTYHFEYSISYYTNKQNKSILNHSISYRKILYSNKILYKYYDFSSLFEQFCYDHKYNIEDTTENNWKNWKETISYKYNGTTNYGRSCSSFDKWNNAENFIKTDTLEQKAVDQILYPEKYYDVKNFYAQLDSANNIKIKPEKRKKPKIEIPIYISGTIIDSITHEALPYSNIIIKNLEDSTKKIIGAITNEDGKFMIDVLLGYKYFVQISHLGYKTISDTLDLYVDDSQLGYSESFNLNADNIELSPDLNLLKTVTIKGETKSIDIDKQSTIITPQMRKNTIAVKDIFNKIDAVSFNKITEEIKVDGSKKVKLLVDGMEKSNDYILNLNPKRVKKIEILRNIYGLYATEGYTSIINIITYDNYRGYDIIINDQFLQNIRSKSSSYFLQNTANLSLNITRDKWSYYVKTYNDYNNINLLTRNQSDFSTNNETIINSSNSLNKYNNYGISLGTDYKINKKHLIGAEIGFSGFPAFDNNTTVSFDTLMMNGQTTIMQNTTNNNSNFNKLSCNLHYKYKINTTSDFITYLYLSNKQSTLNQDINYGQKLNYEQTSNNLNYKLEYNKTFKNKYTLTIGGRYLENTFKSINQDTIQNIFINNYSKISAYSFFKIKFTKNTGLLMGGSYENYKSENNSINMSFNSLQPKINIYKQISKKQKIVLSYSTNVEYPYLSDMNPQITYLSPFIASTGNPKLSPYLYHNFSLQYSKISDGIFSYLSVKPYYNYSDNEIGKNPITNDSIIIYQNANFVKHEQYGIYTSLSLSINKKLKLDFDFDVYKDWNKNLTTPQVIDWYGSSEVTYTISTKHYLGLIYQKEYVKNVSSLGYTKSGVNYFMIYWKTLQLKGKLQLMLGYSLPLLSNQINEDFEETPYYIKNNYTDVSFINNMIMVNLVYRFSKGKIQKEKNIDYEDYDNHNTNKTIGL